MKTRTSQVDAKAEEEQLDFKLKYGSALLKQESYVAAEDALRYVHGRLIELHSDHDVRRADTRAAQEQLCIALREQEQKEKLREAGKLHAHAAVGLGWEGKHDDDVWEGTKCDTPRTHLRLTEDMNYKPNKQKTSAA